MAHRIALATALVLALAAAPLRAWLELPRPLRPCAPAGRGEPPRHHLGCAVDGGPGRTLAADERLVLGLPLDPNTAGTRELAFVPGLSRRLAQAIAVDRERHGRFAEVGDLARVRGIGARKLAAAAPHLAIGPP